MGILAWIVLGAAAGWIASLLVRTNYKQGLLINIIMGIIGALVGGFLAELLSQSGITGLNLYSLLVAVIGAVVVIIVGQQLHIGGSD